MNIVTNLQASSGWGKRVVCSPNHPYHLCGPHSCSVGTGCFIPRCNVAGEWSQLLALFLVLELKMKGAIPPVLYLPSWHTQGQLYLYFI